MITLAIMVAIPIIAALYAMKQKASRDEVFGTFGLALFLTAIFGGLFLYGTELIPQSDANLTYTTTQTPLRTIQDGTDLHGQFYLFGGYIDQHPAFTYYVETPEGLKLKQIDAKDATIKEDSESPHLEYVKCFAPGHWDSWRHEHERGSKWNTNHCDDKHIFHVPPGSVKQQVQLGVK